MGNYLSLIFIAIFFGGAAAQTVDPQESLFQFPEFGPEEITPELMTGEAKIIYIGDQWKFMPGDNPEWADPGYDDSDWELISTNLTEADLAFVEWTGTGWFRKQLKVVPELTGKPVALIIDRHLGASEIYLNGEKVLELGAFSIYPNLIQTYNSGTPHVLVFSEQEIQTIAVRFINPDFMETGRLLGYSGFRFLLGDWESHQHARYTFLTEWTGHNMFYIGILLAFCVIHFLLFVFYPVEKRNLYFSLFVGFLALLSYFYFRVELAELTVQTMLIARLMTVTEIIVLVFATRFTHSIYKENASLYTNLLMAGGFISAVLVWFYQGQLVWLREMIVLIFVAEILRTLLVMFYKNRKGAWVLGTGVFVFVIGLIYGALINFQFIEGNVLAGNMIGSGTLILTMSIYLSRDFASTQKKLEHKLNEVQMLSRKALEQERINKKREIETRLLEAENQRKTLELEEARALQLSMLPKKLPILPHYDMAVYMETATEVGGDYYDYSLNKDGTLVLALGDATGHGMKAGIMVAAAKSYFHTLVHETDSLTMLSRISSGLRNMNMKMMYMGFMIAHCKNGEIEIATAGMPPALHYSKNNSRVNQVVLKGLPLGSKVNYPYKCTKLVPEKGDVMLFMSDGLTELFDRNREMLGIDKVADVIMDSSGYTAQDIINQLKRLVETWSGGLDPHDDITMMVLKIPED